jgi:hypothetical protein
MLRPFLINLVNSALVSINLHYLTKTVENHGT